MPYRRTGPKAAWRMSTGRDHTGLSENPTLDEPRPPRCPDRPVERRQPGGRGQDATGPTLRDTRALDEPRPPRFPDRPAERLPHGVTP